jgi:L-amino acid N-acyltransferase YncA
MALAVAVALWVPLSSPTMINAEVLTALKAWSPEQLASWSPTWREELTRWAAPSLALVGDTTWGGAVRDAVQLPVADPLLWANRRISLRSGGWAIAGIRFRGRDIEKPFVDIIATSATPDYLGIAELGDVLAHFEAFAPLCLRVHLPGDARGAAAPAGPSFASVPDQLVVAGPVAQMTKQARSPRFDSVQLVRAVPADAAARVAEIYDEVRRSNPRLDEWATPSSGDSLADADEEALLFDIVVEGRIAGVVAATRDNAYGFTGFTVEEIALDSAHRRRGYGLAVLQHLAQRLPVDASDVLWGHIHPDNAPSLRNALASGRTVVSSLVWVTPDGYPGMPGAQAVR